MSSGVAAIVVAGGRGLRVGGQTPKQYLSVGGQSVMRLSLMLFADHPEISTVQPVIHPDDQELYKKAAEGLKISSPTAGGTTRQASVRAGLEALAKNPPSIVLVHDAARPFASSSLISRAIRAAVESGAAIPGLAVTDTVKAVDQSGIIAQTLDRSRLRIVQTPQAFDYAKLLDAHRRAAKEGRDDFTDDAALAEWAGLKVSVFEGEKNNVKLTSADDFVRAEQEHALALADIRTGNGFDVHAFGEGDHVTLGGLRIPHGRGLSGHSDADVALHALTDAVLGALADGDIGSHFPPSDPQWRGASSDRFLAFAVERVRARGGRITHLDLTIVCETPRIGPHRDKMRERIAEIVGIGADRVAVKATTSEQLGFTGRSEGIVAMATATVRLPWTE
ncbi:MAG TPA: bifunctional 2-C-methyl-D-erythritol 4-phosphate cytidylyltransferase/2-C-methyl-D-erythritol 2,4-cyclodiphosphate synthase [Xanthobacteraceae bacterium]|jgi:2-C-methyl-D-erythritol 4-phosphate cytidylyltransferase/2-C-methyl-D-erythritol 2,4-cyclodiphosphate synthase|nr:bifunctional 2-C-methyl-D-erythritol 4-phosphate cytidylyltransferase/2-C-methyl-D-erythritol 2,4-cyclodiphosphate synthase [Xanthobacteraceae bacterium]